MAKCPRDGTPIDVDYGMATCPRCGVILFVDMDGEAMIGSQGPRAQTPPDSPSDSKAAYSQTPFEPEKTEVRAAPVPPPLPGPTDFIQEMGIESQGEDPLAALNPMPMPMEVEVEAEPMSPEPMSPEPMSPEPMSPEPMSPEPTDMNMDQFLGYEEPSPPAALEADPMAPPEPVGGPGDPLGIADYANSEFSQAKDGPFLFRLVVSGIDSKELREAVREAMSDERFAWDVTGLLRNITKGELHIRNVSPVKATILINRIKRLPVKIRWEQYPVSQAEPG